MKRINYFLVFIFAIASCNQSITNSPKSNTVETKNQFRVIGYFCGPTNCVDSIEVEKLTHLIFCFGHLNGNRFEIGSSGDSLTIKKMVELKKKNSQLKVMLSLGGWGGCTTCSDVFNFAEGRKEFAQSVKEVTEYFKTDGLDLDWEYPVISGFPGHRYQKNDKKNFTELLKEIRETNGKKFELSFAAGGFTQYIDSCIDWKNATKYFNFVNVMSYDLVHGYSKKSGHHTPLYSTPRQKESTDNAVQLLLKKNVPSSKIIIGAAFYGRFFKIEWDNTVDLDQPAHFSHGFQSKYIRDSLTKNRGFELHWDSIACAPYAINEKRRLLATYDDSLSIEKKTKYAIENHLGGIMFWQLMDDKWKNGLLEVIFKTKNKIE